MLQYCDKCGHLWQKTEGLDLDEKYNLCQICKNHLKIVPDEYYNNPNFKVLLSEDMEQKLINDLVLTSPNFDQYFFEHREEIKEQQDREYYDNIAYCKAIMEGKSRVPRCLSDLPIHKCSKNRLHRSRHIHCILGHFQQEDQQKLQMQ